MSPWMRDKHEKTSALTDELAMRRLFFIAECGAEVCSPIRIIRVYHSSGNVST